MGRTENAASFAYAHKLTLNMPVCTLGDVIEFVSHFAGTGPNGAVCEATSGRLSKTCK